MPMLTGFKVSTSNQERICILIEGRVLAAYGETESARRAAHFTPMSTGCFMQKMWGNLKKGISESPYLYGSEIPRDY